MAYAPVSPLVVLTHFDCHHIIFIESCPYKDYQEEVCDKAALLLQLSRAEISNALPETWYSANVIQDGFQPIALSEIFSTPPVFSSTNPIIVLPKLGSESNKISHTSTVPPSSIRTSDIRLTSDPIPKYTLIPSTLTTPSPPIIQTLAPSTLSTANSQTQSRSQFIMFQEREAEPQLEISQRPEILSQPQITQSTISPSTSVFQQGTQETVVSIPQQISKQTTVSITQSVPRQTTMSIPVPTTLSIPEVPNSLSQNPVTFNLSPLTSLIQRQPDTSKEITQQLQTMNGSRPNYILIYQQAPQYIQADSMLSSPNVPQTTRLQPPISTTVRPNIGSTLATSFQPIFGTNLQYTPSLPSITSSEVSTMYVYPSTRISSVPSRTVPSKQSTAVQPIGVNGFRTSRPKCNSTGSCVILRSATRKFPLKIRVIAPQGSITNLHFRSLTTTTKKPTTRKTRKPKRNTYDSCVAGCKGNRKRICGTPLSSKVINTNTLKGFPSVCHMACHNSYRKVAYEQLLEGRCSLLRTRIRTIDSNEKLKRDDLNKSYYIVDNKAPHTVVEFTGAL